MISSPSQAGQLLAARRKVLKLSQQAVSAKLGISQNRYSELEMNPSRLTLDRLITLASILGLEVVLKKKSGASPSREW
jgi:HTH-type transcriptional regulator/antitoxin HipB